MNNEYTGEETEVTVDPDKIMLYEDKSIFGILPHTCPFFRHEPGSEKAFCTVHLTRPAICRDYGCWRLLILDSRGRRAGKIRFVRTLDSEDEDLTRLWDSCADEHREQDDAKWEDAMVHILTRAGYTVRK